MGLDFAGISISSIINAEIGSRVSPATLHSRTAGARLVGRLSAGRQPVETDYACRAFDEPVTSRRQDMLARGTDTIISITGDSVAGGSVAPKPDDGITFNGKRYVVLRVGTDPARALQVCECRAAAPKP